jgi:hypothetical protein
VPDLLGQRLLALGGALELRPPLGECAVALGDGGQLEGGDVVLDAHRALQYCVAALVVVVRQRQQALANDAAVAQPEVPHAADAIGRLALLYP